MDLFFEKTPLGCLAPQNNFYFTAKQFPTKANPSLNQTKLVPNMHFSVTKLGPILQNF